MLSQKLDDLIIGKIFVAINSRLTIEISHTNKKYNSTTLEAKLRATYSSILASYGSLMNHSATPYPTHAPKQKPPTPDAQ